MQSDITRTYDVRTYIKEHFSFSLNVALSYTHLQQKHFTNKSCDILRHAPRISNNNTIIKEVSQSHASENVALLPIK